MSYADYRAGYLAGYTIGYGDGVRWLEPDDRPLTLRFKAEPVRISGVVVEEDGQLAFDFAETKTEGNA